MKTKTFLLIVIINCLFGWANAQPRILNEPLQLHNAQPNYSARFAAVGGAFTSLGADVSSLYHNPAGLAMYRSVEVIYGPGLSFKSNSSNFSNSKTNDVDFLFEGGTGGIVITTKRNQPNLKYLNFGFAFHNSKNNNFSKTYSGLDEYINDYGYDEVIELEETTETTGSRYTELAFSIAANYQDRFFIGANITTPRYIFDQQINFTQRDIENRYYWDEYSYSETISVSTENSINIGLGLVYKINNNFRLGANIKSSSIITLQEEYSNFELETDDYGVALVDSSIVFDPFFYVINTPPKIDIGLSYLNSKGFIAVDAGYIFNNRMRYFNEDLGEDGWVDYNIELNNLLKNSFVIRVGGEFVPQQNFRLRAGYNVTTSLAQNNKNNSATHNVSLGAGLRKAVFETETSSSTVFADVALKYRFYKSQYEIYEDLENGPFVDFKYNQLQLITTFGFKF